jgi:signal transduction histidine kinase
MRSLRSFLPYFFLGLFIIGLLAANFFQAQIFAFVPGIHPYIILGISVLAIIVIVILVWKKNQEIEKARYEFVSVATHKFRTPLSGIKWSADQLASELSHEEKEDVIKQLRNAVDRLIQIVDLLVNFAKTDAGLEFAFGAVSFREMIQEAMLKFGPTSARKILNLILIPILIYL